MNKDPMNEGGMGGKAICIHPMIRKMVHERTRELALAAGRDPLQVTHSDYQRARRDITGESEFERQDAVLNALQRKNVRANRKRSTNRPGHLGTKVPGDRNRRRS